MRYYRKPIFSTLEKIGDSGESMAEWEIAELMESLAKGLKRDLLGIPERCKMEDGRETWMVRYSKYARIKRQSLDLKAENDRLKESVLKLSK